jgi:membrane-bound lytic murein transglycosylase D
VDLYAHSIEISPELAGRIQENLEPARYDLRVTLNEDVLSAIDFFLKNRNGRKLMKIGLERIGLYEEEIRRILREAGLPTDLVYLAQLESNFFPNALSSAKAAGLWQFVAETGIRYGLKVDWWVDERNDPYKSTQAATRYLKFLHEQLNDWYLVMASYNTGEGRIIPLVRRGLQDFWKISEQRLIARETREFVPLILAIAIIGKSRAEFGFEVQAAEPERFETLVLERPVTLKVLVRRAGLDLEELRRLNPELKQDVTPQYSRSYALRLPPGTLATVTQRLSSLSPRQRMGS